MICPLVGRAVRKVVEAWGGPRDGEQFAVVSPNTGRWDAFRGQGFYSLETVERRQHKLVMLRSVLKWHQGK
jgi:hypothetical protein